jgi:hypothetical protein
MAAVLTGCGGGLPIPPLPTPTPTPTATPTPEPTATPTPPPHPCQACLEAGYALCNRSPYFLTTGCCNQPPGEACTLIPPKVEAPGDICKEGGEDLDCNCWNYQGDECWHYVRCPGSFLPGVDPVCAEPPVVEPGCSSGTLKILIVAWCAGADPNCGEGADKPITVDHSAKSPLTLRAKRGRSLKLDATYYCDTGQGPTLGNRIHVDDPHYPGPMSGWEQKALEDCGEEDCHVDCSDPQSNGHVIVARGFDFRSKTRFTVEGPGAEPGEFVVTVR